MKRNSGWLLLTVACMVFLLGMALPAIPAQAQSFAYVTSSSNTVSKIDTASNTVVATIPVGNLPTGVAVTLDGTRVYVANDFVDTVSVIDTANNTVVATVPAGHTAQFVAITPDGTRAYVTETVRRNQTPTEFQCIAKRGFAGRGFGSDINHSRAFRRIIRP